MALTLKAMFREQLKRIRTKNTNRPLT